MTMLATRWRLLPCSVALLACASSELVQPDTTSAGSHAGDSATAGRAGMAAGAADAAITSPEELRDASAPVTPSCDLQLGSCPAREDYDAWKVLLDAASFGEEARFVGMGHRAVLVADVEPAFRVVLMGAAWADERTDEVWPLPEGLEGIDVVSSDYEGVFALACDATDRCTVLRGTSFDPELIELPAGALPSRFEPRGIVFDSAQDPYAVCVYGNGMLCDGGDVWVEAIAIEADLQLNDVSITWASSLAVGSHGRYFERVRSTEHVGTWVEQPPLADVELTSALVTGLGAVIVGEGRVQAALGDLRDALGCGTPEDLVTFVSVRMAVTRDGRVLYQSRYDATTPGTGTFFPGGPGEFCEHQTFMLGDLLDASEAPCGLAQNPRVRFDRYIVGMDTCPIG